MILSLRLAKDSMVRHQCLKSEDGVETSYKCKHCEFWSYKLNDMKTHAKKTGHCNDFFLDKTDTDNDNEADIIDDTSKKAFADDTKKKEQKAPPKEKETKKSDILDEFKKGREAPPSATLVSDKSFALNSNQMDLSSLYSGDEKNKKYITQVTRLAASSMVRHRCLKNEDGVETSYLCKHCDFWCYKLNDMKGHAKKTGHCSDFYVDKVQEEKDVAMDDDIATKKSKGKSVTFDIESDGSSEDEEKVTTPKIGSNQEEKGEKEKDSRKARGDGHHLAGLTSDKSFALNSNQMDLSNLYSGDENNKKYITQVTRLAQNSMIRHRCLKNSDGVETSYLCKHCNFWCYKLNDMKSHAKKTGHCSDFYVDKSNTGSDTMKADETGDKSDKGKSVTFDLESDDSMDEDETEERKEVIDQDNTPLKAQSKGNKAKEERKVAAAPYKPKPRDFCC